MSNVLTKIIGSKRQWKAMEARVDALPSSYGLVYGEIKSYLWKISSGDGMHTIAVLDGIITTFEAGSARGEEVRAVTGEDVAAFCDARMTTANPKTYLDEWRATLNADVTRKARTMSTC